MHVVSFSYDVTTSFKNKCELPGTYL